MTKEKPSISHSKESSPTPPTQTSTPKTSPTQTSGSKPSPTQTSGSKPSPSTHPAEDVEETRKTFDETQTTQTQQEAEVNM